MPGGKTQWLNLENGNGVKVFQWCKSVKRNTEVAFCTLCCKQSFVNNRGFIQVKQHSKSAKHRQIPDTPRYYPSKKDSKPVEATGKSSEETSSNKPATVTSSKTVQRQMRVFTSPPLKHQVPNLSCCGVLK